MNRHGKMRGCERDNEERKKVIKMFMKFSFSLDFLLAFFDSKPNTFSGIMILD
jgi:hypothetical protein